MADRPNTTYMAIPPPPLSEFYLNEPSSRTSSSSASNSEISYAKTSKSGKHHSRTKTVVTQPPSSSIDNAPPLAVYHICRICVRPRSARYHREHPIPIDGLPPPPGICRRCRITSVSGSEAIREVIEYEEKGDVRLGIRSLVPDEDYFTQKEMRAKSAREVTEWVEVEPAPTRERGKEHRRIRVPSAAPSPQSEEQRVVYRNVYVTVPPPPPSGPPPWQVVSSTAQEAVDIYRNTSAANRVTSTAMKAPGPTPKASVTTVESAKEEVKFDSNCATKGSATRASSIAASSGTTNSKRMHGNHTQVIVEAYRPERSESDIRRLARDEIERYRQAERLMEAHGKPYARGKFVPVEEDVNEYERIRRIPVERRITMEKDIVEEKPWEQKSARPRPNIVASPPREYIIRNIDPQRDVEIIFEDTHRRAKGEISQKAESFRQAPASSTNSSATSSGKTYWPSVRGDPGPGAQSGLAVSRPTERSEALSTGNTERPKSMAESSRRYSDSSTFEIGSLTGKINDDGADFEGSFLRAKERRDSKMGVQYIDKKTSQPRDSSTIEVGNFSGRVHDEGVDVKGDSVLTKEKQESSAFVNTSLSGRLRPDEEGFQFDGDFVRAKEKRASGVLGQSKLGALRSPPSSPPRAEDIKKARRTPFPRDGSITPTPMPSPRSHVSTRLSASTEAASRPEPRSEYYYVERLAQRPEPPPSKRASEEPTSEYTYVERKVERVDPPHGSQLRGDSPEVTYVEEERLLRRRRSPQEQLIFEDDARGRSRDNDARQRASDISSKVRFAKKIEYSPTPPGSDASSTQFRGLRQIKKVAGKTRSERGEDLIAEFERRSLSRSRLAAERSSNLWERDTGTDGQQDRGRIVGLVGVDRDRTPRPTARQRRPSGSSETATLPSNVRPLARAKSESPSRERLLAQARKQKSDGLGPYAVGEERSASLEVEDGSISSTSSSDRYVRYRPEYRERRDRRADERRGKR